jgi:hypothetical protein
LWLVLAANAEFLSQAHAALGIQDRVFVTFGHGAPTSGTKMNL